VAARTHCAERTLRREHESLLVEWARAGRAMLRTALAVEALQALVAFGLVAWLLASYLGPSNAEVRSALLFVYWALNVPMLGQQIAVAARQYPTIRNLTLRLLEPLGALDESGAEPPPRGASVSQGSPAADGVAIEMESVGVIAVDGNQEEKSLPVRTWREPRSLPRGTAINIRTQRLFRKKARRR